MGTKSLFSSSSDPSYATRLAAMVRNRDLQLLREYGGVDGILRSLHTDSENGIPGDADDITGRREIFGSNSGQEPRKPAQKAIKRPAIMIIVCFILFLAWRQVGSELVQAILAAAMAWAMMKLWPFALFPRHFSTPHCLDYEPRVDVVRKCGWMKLPVSGVVVGDVVFLKPGDQVPADGLFINGNSFQLKTAKRDREEVGEKNPIIYSGETVAGGYCRMVVTAVGKICRSHPAPEKMIPATGRHAREIQNLTTIIGRIGKAVALTMFIWLLLRFWIEGNGTQIGVADLVGMLSSSAIIAFTSSLEGLDLAVQSTLAFSVRSLWNDHVLIRRPAICHQLAFVDTICFNKTGTLSSDSAEVKKFWLGLSSIEEVPPNIIAPNVLELLHQAIGLNTTRPRLSSTYASSLSLTEQAVYKWAREQLGMETENLRRSCTILENEPFNPSNRKSGVLISKNNAIHVHKKGAVDSILPMCSDYYDSNGIVNEITSTMRAQLEKIVVGMEKDGLRCIAFAHRKTSIQEYFSFSNQTLTLLGLVGLKNPMRSGIVRVVEDCERAGIEIKLLTGDSTLTTEFMALRGGLLDPDIKPGQVVEGKEFRNLSGEERMKKVCQIRVLTRATSLDKLLMVECLRKSGRVVAYVGGGQGDVQALKEANVGICFGTENSAEILKKCSNIVIREKKIPQIIEVVRWGRGFYDNIEAYTQFLLTAAVVHLVVCFVITISPSQKSFLRATSTGEVPVPVFELLWARLILGIVAALFVLIKQPSGDLMSLPARDLNEPLVDDGMQMNIIAQALYQILVLLAIHFNLTLLELSPSEKNTAIFRTYVLCQVFTLINEKLPDRKNNKKCFWGIIAIIIVLKVMMVDVWNKISGTRLDGSQWTICIFVAAASTPICQFLVHLPYGDNPITPSAGST